MLSVRPKVAELAFQLYGRALHPELFKVFRSCRAQRGDHEARLDITSAGHVITWRYRGLTLTEVAAAANHPLPKRRRLLNYRLRDERSDRVECRGGIVYETTFQLDTIAPELFWVLQQELAREGERSGLMHQFDSSGRMALGALSYMHVETRSRSMRVQAFHTFPDDFAIVRSRSTFELP
ncbi:MAG: DUF2617 family protein [Planctomycetes bacterium]|nr:DUF2617 family protein [Planctomycetota bacterium]